MAYLENRKTVDKVLVVLGRYSTTGRAIMATYMTENGKAFAWQVLFEMEKWKQISQATKIKSYEKLPGEAEEKPAKTITKKPRKPAK